MAFDLNALSAFSQNDISNAVNLMTASTHTAKYVRLFPNVKERANLFFMDTTAVPQTASCDPNPIDTTTLSQKTIEVVKLGFYEKLCLQQLNGFAAEQWLRNGAKAENEDVDQLFRNLFIEQKTKKIGYAISKLLWLGDTDSPTPAINKIDGWLKLVTDSGDVVNGNTSGETEITKANIQTILDNIQLAMPTELMQTEKPVFAYCGIDTLMKASMKARDAFNVPLVNATGGNIADAGAIEFTYPGLSYTLVGMPELNGTNRIITTYYGNLIHGFDGAGEGLDTPNADTFELQLDPQWKKSHWFLAEVKVGAQIAEEKMVVDFTLAD